MRALIFVSMLPCVSRRLPGGQQAAPPSMVRRMPRGRLRRRAGCYWAIDLTAPRVVEGWPRLSTLPGNENGPSAWHGVFGRARPVI